MLLLLHGALGSAAQFAPLLTHLPDDRAVFPLDFPGHGGLPNDGHFSLDLFAGAVLRFLDEKKQSRADVFGYSMGGYVALFLAAKHPERIGRVIALNTKLDWQPDSAARIQGMMNPEKIEAKAPQMAANLAAMHAPEDWKTLARHSARFLESLGSGAGMADGDFQKIACPVLLLRGERDNVVTAEECRRVAGLIIGAVFREIAGGGHLLEQVDCQAIARELLFNNPSDK